MSAWPELEQLPGRTAKGHWYVLHAGGREGPMRAAVLEAALERGCIDRESLVWRSGLPGWEPMLVHFLPAAPGRDALALLAGVLAVALAAVLSVTLHLGELERFGGLRQGLAVWGLSLVVLVGVALGAAGAARRRARLLQPLWPKAAALQRLGALVMLLPAAGIVLMQAATMPGLYPTLALREALRDYRFTDVETPHGPGLHVLGSIGPGFDRALRRALDKRPATGRVILSSPGGLVDEAMAAAQTLERRALVTEARGECDSACILVLLAGVERYAEWNMTLGFHAVHNLHGTRGASSDPVVEALAADAEAYMRSRGVPAALLEVAAGYAANEVHRVGAIDLVGAGTLSGVTGNGGTDLPLPEAQWRFVEGLYRWRDPAGPMARLMSLARSSRPALMEHWAPPVYAAYRSASPERAGELLGGFAGELFVPAVLAADDGAVAAYYHQRLLRLRTLAEGSRWQHCAALIDGDAVVGAGAQDASGTGEDVGALLALAESAAGNDWRPAAMAPDVVARGQELVSAELYRVAGDPTQDPRARCEGFARVYHALLQAPPAESAAVLRWLGAPTS